MKRDYKLYLKDILEAIARIGEFVEELSLEKFWADDKTSSAVIRKFEIIGEAVKNIPKEIKKQYPDIPWREISGMRDKLIHFYMGVDYELVWDTIKTRLPELKSAIKKILRISSR